MASVLHYNCDRPWKLPDNSHDTDFHPVLKLFPPLPPCIKPETRSAYCSWAVPT